MSIIRKGLAALVVAGAVTVLPVLATPAAAAPIHDCTFHLDSVHASDLFHDGGTDRVFIKVGQTWGPPDGTGVAFSAPNNRDESGSSFDPADEVEFVDDVDVLIAIDTFPINRRTDAVSISCVEVTNAQRSLIGNGFRYVITYDVTATP